jgi:hypothetical protein
LRLRVVVLELRYRIANIQRQGLDVALRRCTHLDFTHDRIAGEMAMLQHQTLLLTAATLSIMATKAELVSPTLQKGNKSKLVRGR